MKRTVIITIVIAIVLLAVQAAIPSSRGTQIEMFLNGVTDPNTYSPASGAWVYVYSAGTTSNKTTWTDRTKQTATNNPFQLNAQGQAQVYGDGIYKFVIKDTLGATLYTYDNISVGSIPGPWVDVSDYASLTAAVAALGSVNKVTLMIAADTTTTANTTVTPNITIMMKSPGRIVKHGTDTLSIGGAFISESYQCFSGFTTGLSFGAKSGTTLNPKWWGATGDGTTDDQPASQSAINALEASGGGHIHFPAGTYLMTSVHDPSQALAVDFVAASNSYPISITGSGAALVTDTTNSAILLLNIAGSTGDYAKDVSVSGLEFRGTRVPTDDDIGGTQNNHLLYLTYVKNVKVTDCTFKNTNGGGIYGYVDKAIISHNMFLDTNAGAQFGLAKHLTIDDNQFICTKKADDQVAVFGTAGGLSHDIMISNNLIDKGYDGLKGSGGTARGWARGIYFGDYVYDISILGNRIENINSVNSADKTSGGLVGIYLQTSITTTNVTISNNTIRNVFQGIAAAHTINDFIISGNNISEAESGGIQLSGSGVSLGSGLIISGNHLRSIGTSTTVGTTEAVGILANDYSNAQIEGNSLTDMDVYWAMNIGVSGSTLYADNVVIRGNSLSYVTTPTNTTTSYALLMNRIRTGSIENNRLKYITQYSIYTSPATTATYKLSGNVLEDFTSGTLATRCMTTCEYLSSGNYERPYGELWTGRNTGLKIPRPDNNQSLSIMQGTAMPSTGSYVTGDVVYITSTLVSGTSDTYINHGWKRVTTGSANAANVDWREMRMHTGP